VTRLSGALNTFGLLCFLPAVVAHELTHAAVATNYAHISVEQWVPPRLSLRYPEGTPNLVVIVANIAPTIVGTIVCLLSVDALLRLVDSNPVLGAYAVGLLAIYLSPSADDLSVLTR